MSELLPPGEALIEERFKEINRIADVAWPRYKIIFEIQYSPLSFEEMESRILDYQSIGWTVIWILHLHSFFKGRPSREELLLAPYPHYYSNHTREGKGYFFDVSWKNPHPPDIQNDVKLHFPLPLQKGKQDLGMRSNWPIHFSGDFIERFFNGRFQFPHLPQKTPFSFSRFLTSAYQYFIEGVFRSS